MQPSVKDRTDYTSHLWKSALTTKCYAAIYGIPLLERQPCGTPKTSFLPCTGKNPLLHSHLCISQRWMKDSWTNSLASDLLKFCTEALDYSPTLWDNALPHQSFIDTSNFICSEPCAELLLWPRFYFIYFSFSILYLLSAVSFTTSVSMICTWIVGTLLVYSNHHLHIIITLYKSTVIIIIMLYKSTVIIIFTSSSCPTSLQSSSHHHQALQAYSHNRHALQVSSHHHDHIITFYKSTVITIMFYKSPVIIMIMSSCSTSLQS